MSMSAEYSNESGPALDDKYSPNEESSKSQNVTALVADGDVESNNDSKYPYGARRIAICLTLALALFLPMLVRATPLAEDIDLFLKLSKG
jgi:hypothetical protein